LRRPEEATRLRSPPRVPMPWFVSEVVLGAITVAAIHERKTA